jgi:microcystin-dependent protein
MFGGNFAPRGYALCNGQILAIAQNDALYALIGTTYGGNGQETFALPDLRGRVPVHRGQGPGLSNYVIGQVGGSEAVTLTLQQMPLHTHAAQADPNTGTANSPAAHSWAAQSGAKQFAPGAAANTTMSPQAVTLAGGSQPHDNMMSFLVIHFIIALEGVFPSRN